ncbi:hypothetical protein [Synechococcus sp. BIOS-E4-1]
MHNLSQIAAVDSGEISWYIADFMTYVFAAEISICLPAFHQKYSAP